MKKLGGLKLLKIGRLICLMTGAASAALAPGTERETVIFIICGKEVSRLRAAIETKVLRYWG